MDLLLSFSTVLSFDLVWICCLLLHFGLTWYGFPLYPYINIRIVISIFTVLPVGVQGEWEISPLDKTLLQVSQPYITLGPNLTPSVTDITLGQNLTLTSLQV